MFHSTNAPVNPSSERRDGIGDLAPEHIVAEGVDVAIAIGRRGKLAQLVVGDWSFSVEFEPPVLVSA